MATSKLLSTSAAVRAAPGAVIRYWWVTRRTAACGLSTTRTMPTSAPETWRWVASACEKVARPHWVGGKVLRMPNLMAMEASPTRNEPHNTMVAVLARRLASSPSGRCLASLSHSRLRPVYPAGPPGRLAGTLRGPLVRYSDVSRVGRQIQDSVAGQPDHNDLAVGRGARVVERRGDRMRRLRRRDDRLGARKDDARREGGVLLDRDRVDQAEVHRVRDHRRHPVIAQPTRVDGRRNEVLAQGVHLQQRRQPGDVTEVVPVLALGQRRAGGGFAGHRTRRGPLPQVLPDERERQTTQVRAAAGAAEDHVGLLLPRLGQLDEHLLPDDGLVQHDVVENAA